MRMSYSLKGHNLFSVLDLGSALPKKTCVFSAKRANWIVADFRKKHSYFREKTLKNRVYFRG